MTTLTPTAVPAARPPDPPAEPSPGRRGRWPAATSLGSLAFLALLAYLPLLLVRPGVVTADTKTYLYIDPGHFLASVASMWNPQVALGTVTHEYIGYLLPMGPFFWFFSVIHVPVWVAQRLWLGSILFAAGAGIWYLGRVLGLRGPGRVVAAVAYMLSPYVLQYAGRISVILLPWCGLPFMVAFAVLAVRRGGWRYPALFALVVAVVSGINASSVLYAGVAPALWIVYAVLVERQAPWGQALAAAGRLVLLSAVVCLWWVVGLGVEAGYGVNVLKFTETVPSTSQTSSAAEVLRGLGYWYFYAADLRLGPWTDSVVLYTQWLWVIGLSFAVPALAFAGAMIVRWRHRAYFVLLVVIGVALSVGAHPYNVPTPLGRLLKDFMTETTAGLAMRSTDRATPLVALGLALLLGAAVSALWRRRPGPAVVTALVVMGLVVANNPAIFTGDAVAAPGLTQPAVMPAPERQAAAHLNATHPNTRVLEIPGDDFNAKRWGDTVDPEMVGLLSDARPFVIHEQQVMGSYPTADLLYAIDEPIQNGTEQWNALAPMARLASVGDVLVQNDTQYERYGIPAPQVLFPELTPTPAGLSDPVTYGQPVKNVSVNPTLNEQVLGGPANPTPPPPLVSYTVDQPRPIVRAESATGSIIVAGDATGLANMAAAGLLDTDSAIYYAGTLDAEPARLRQLLAAGAALVVTDTNRKQAFRWDTLDSQAGYTETQTENPAAGDPSDNPLDLFPGAPVTAHTVVEYRGAASVSASSYGNPVSYSPESQPYAALDANPDTAWQTGIYVPDPAGQWWQLGLSAPVTENHVTLTQTLDGDVNRWITKVTLTFDGGHPVTTVLGPASRRPGGQVVRFGARRFSTLRITVDGTSDDHSTVAEASEIGFSSVAVPGVSVHEVTVLPTDLLAAAGPTSRNNRLTLVMTRLRVSPYPPQADPETAMTRDFTLPTTRTFTLSGQASLSALVPDDVINRLTGQTLTAGAIPVLAAYSSGRLPGDLAGTTSATIDGDPTTLWQPGFGTSAQRGAWLQYVLGQPLTFDHLDLVVAADGRHSVPTEVTITTGSGSRTVRLPPVADARVAGATTSVPLSFAPLTGQRIRITFSGVRLESSSNFYSPSDLAVPLGVAEVGIPGLVASPPPSELPGTCLANLLAIDGVPYPVRVSGPVASALGNGEVSVTPCGADARGITLGPGTHVLKTAVGHQAGWQLDQLVLDSAAGGGPATVPATPTTVPSTQPGPAPTVTTTARGATAIDLRVTKATGPFELVLGQSVNTGWQAVAHPAPGAAPGSRPVDLGRPQLVDGFANGWPVTATQLAALGVSTGGAFTVSLRWTPQRAVWLALGVSAGGLVLCLVLACLPAGARARRRRRRRGPGPARAGPGPRGTDVSVAEPSPDLGSPLTGPGRRPVWWVLVLVSLAAGAAAGGLVSPLVGVAVAAATATGLAWPGGRITTSLTALGLVVACGAVVVYGQATAPVPASSTWPDVYEGAALLAWMAVVFLGADALVELVRTRAGRPGPLGLETGDARPPPAGGDHDRSGDPGRGATAGVAAPGRSVRADPAGNHHGPPTSGNGDGSGGPAR